MVLLERICKAGFLVMDSNNIHNCYRYMIFIDIPEGGAGWGRSRLLAPTNHECHYQTSQKYH